MASRTPWRAATRLGRCQLVPKRQIRQLSLHEYQSQDLLRERGAPVPRGKVATTPAEVRAAVEELGSKCVLKSQIYAGGRGKGQFTSGGLQSGIQLVDSATQAEEVSSKMFGSRLRTKQTISEGLPVEKIYVAEQLAFENEWYLAIAIDRENYKPAVIISKSGGTDVETIAKERPEELLTFHFGLTEGIAPGLLEKIAKSLNLSAEERTSMETVLRGLYAIFTEKEATLLEINPLTRNGDGTFTCLDSKFTFDNAASYRQKELFALHDETQEIPDEIEATNHGLVYVRMDGNIGNVVNGAGLAMVTNDAIGHHGGSSANFLDAGGKATKETMIKAFEIITRDERVKVILVNIYGGLTRCDMIAESIIGAADELDMKVPIVVRLQGTNSKAGLELLEKANLGLHVEADFGDAAKRAVELAKA